MPGPIHMLRFVHNAIRVACQEVEDTARSTAVGEDASGLRDAARMLTRAVRGHVAGEDNGYFAPLSERFPDAVASFDWDHRHEAARLDGLDAAADEVARSATEPTIATVLRAAVAVREHLDAHMSKEEQILWPLTEENYSPAEQGAMIAKVVAAVPPPEMPVLVPWIMDRQSVEEAVAYTRGLHQVMPPPAFQAARGWLAAGMAPARHAALVAALPDILG